MEVNFQIGVATVRVYTATDYICITRIFRIQAIGEFPNIGYAIIIAIRPEISLFHLYITARGIAWSIDDTRLLIRVLQSYQISFLIPIRHFRTFVGSASRSDFTYNPPVYFISTQRSACIVQYSFIGNLRRMAGHFTERLVVRHLHSLLFFIRYTLFYKALIKLRPNTVRPIIGTNF